jgi:hypothetical protein
MLVFLIRAGGANFSLLLSLHQWTRDLFSNTPINVTQSNLHGMQREDTH